MHTYSNRANTVLTFFGTVAAVLCVLVAITDVFHQSDPPISVQLEGVKKLSLHRYGKLLAAAARGGM
jgi:hypothetical protein